MARAEVMHRFGVSSSTQRSEQAQDQNRTHVCSSRIKGERSQHRTGWGRDMWAMPGPFQRVGLGEKRSPARHHVRMRGLGPKLQRLHDRSNWRDHGAWETSRQCQAGLAALNKSAGNLLSRAGDHRRY